MKSTLTMRRKQFSKPQGLIVALSYLCNLIGITVQMEMWRNGGEITIYLGPCGVQSASNAGESLTSKNAFVNVKVILFDLDDLYLCITWYHMHYRCFSYESLKYFVAFIVLTGRGNLIDGRCSLPGFVGCLSLKQHSKEKDKVSWFGIKKILSTMSKNGERLKKLKFLYPSGLI